MYYNDLPEPHAGVIFENGEYRSFNIKVYEYGGRDGLYFRLKIGESYQVFFITGSAVASSQLHIEELQANLVKFRNRITQNLDKQLMEDGEIGLSTNDIHLLQGITHTRQETDCILGAMLLDMDYVHDERPITYDVFCDSTELTLDEITERLDYFETRGWIVNRGSNSMESFELTEVGRERIRLLIAELSSKNKESVGTSVGISSIPQEEIMYDIFICYPSPLRKSVAEPLNEALCQIGLSTWFDKAEIGWGDEFLKRIQEGLLQSRFAIVIIGFDSAGRYYQEQEIQSLQKVESSRRKMILPLLHEVSVEQFTRDFPFLSNKQALSTELSFDELAEKAKQVVDQSES